MLQIWSNFTQSIEKRGKILLVINAKEKYYPNKEGIKRLKKSNPREKFRITICKDTKEEVVQVKDGRSWLCLHD